MLFVRNNEYRFKRSGGFLFVVNTDKGTYIKIGGVGSFIWEQLKKPIKKSCLLNKVVNEYEVDKKTASKDIDKTLNQFLKEGIILAQVEEKLSAL